MVDNIDKNCQEVWLKMKMLHNFWPVKDSQFRALDYSAINSAITVSQNSKSRKLNVPNIEKSRSACTAKINNETLPYQDYTVSTVQYLSRFKTTRSVLCNISQCSLSSTQET